MSIRYVDLVLRSALPPMLKLTAVALAKFADADGRRIWPSIATLAQLTSKSVRQVKRDVSTLVRMAVLIPESGRAGGARPTRYRLDVDALTRDTHDTGDTDDTRDTDDTGQDVRDRGERGHLCGTTCDIHDRTRDTDVTPPVTPVSPDPSMKDQEPSKTESIARQRASTLTLTADRRHALATEVADDGNRKMLTQFALHLIDTGIIEPNGDEDTAAEVLAREARRHNTEVGHLRSDYALHGIVNLARLQYRKGLRPVSSAHQPAGLVPVPDLAPCGAKTSPACEPTREWPNLREARTS